MSFNNRKKINGLSVDQRYWRKENYFRSYSDNNRFSFSHIFFIIIGLVGKTLSSLVGGKRRQTKSQVVQALPQRRLVKQPSQMTYHQEVPLRPGRQAPSDRSVPHLFGRPTIVITACVVGIMMLCGAGVGAIVLAQQKNVQLVDGPVVKDVTTTAKTVQELLMQQKLSMGSNDKVEPGVQAALHDDMVVTVWRGMSVSVTIGNGDPQYVTLNQGTVADALKAVHIEPDENDLVEPVVTAVLVAGMRIHYDKIETRPITEKQKIPFKTETEKATKLQEGVKLLKRQGSDGIRLLEIEITIKNGEEIARKIVKDEITKEPVNRIVQVGTMPKPTAKPTAKTTAKTTAKNTPKATATVNHYKVPVAPTKYEEIRLMEVTAYTHTGSKTATGTWPRYTRSWAKPGTVAVAPQVIPYGTLMFIDGYGYAIAEDTGMLRFSNPNQLDVFMNRAKDCIQWGRRRNVKIYIIRYGYKK